MLDGEGDQGQMANVNWLRWSISYGQGQGQGGQSQMVKVVKVSEVKWSRWLSSDD